jgi:hypothetical protein
MMNAEQALALASEHVISVTVDHYTKTAVWFGVGNMVVRKPKGTTIYWTVAENDMTFCRNETGKLMYFKRGEAMEFCIRRILDARQLAGE